MSSNSERCFTEICLVPKIWMARVGTICILRGHLKTDWALVLELDDESLNNGIPAISFFCHCHTLTGTEVLLSVF